MEVPLPEWCVDVCVLYGRARVDHAPIAEVDADMGDPIRSGISRVEEDDVPRLLHPPRHGRCAVVDALRRCARQRINAALPIYPRDKGGAIKGVWSICAISVRGPEVSSCLCVEDGELFCCHGRTGAAVRKKIGVRQSKEERIAMNTVDQDLEVEMRASAGPRTAHRRDHIAHNYCVPGSDKQGVAVGIFCHNSATVVNDDYISKIAEVSGEGDNAILG